MQRQGVSEEAKPLLPRQEWFGFLTNTLPLHRLMGVMLRLFALSPWELRRGLVLGAAKDQAPRF